MKPRLHLFRHLLDSRPTMLENGLVQTGLLLAAPFLLPPVLKHVQSFLNPSPKGTRSTPVREKYERRKDGTPLASFRLFIATLGVSISLFTALSPPHNLFLSLSKPHSFLSRLFPILRYPLDVRLATETLHRAWIHSLSRSLSPTESLLIQRLQTLDARLSYIAYGTGPILDCTWCKPSSSSLDHFLSILPGILIVHVVVLGTIGLLLIGNGRERWRVWAIGAVGGALGNEVWKRLVWEGTMRGGSLGQGQTVSMLHTQLHVQRSLLSALFLLFAYFAPPTSIPLHNSTTTTTTSTPITTSSVIGPTLDQLVGQSQELLEKLRCLSIERMAILHHDEYRSRVNEFWSVASQESKLARSDPTVRALLEQEEENGQVREGMTKEFGEFVERNFVRGLNRKSNVREGEGEGEEEQGEEEGISEEETNDGEEGEE
ncbi:hypothetical protein JCM16303_002543 [Sporobolomyces ruberrimus]